MNAVADDTGAPEYRSTLAALLEGAAQPLRDVEIRDLTLDSRSVTPGAAFLACQGRTTHGVAHAATAVDALLAGASPRCLAQARKLFMREHGRVFWVLGIMQRFWYGSDKRRERFVAICKDKDVQQLTFESYMNKRLVRKKPMAHVRIFFKDMAHLLGLARV